MSGEINQRLRQLEKLLTDENLAKEGFKFFKSVTPIRTGRARRSTTRNQTTIEANYPYARRLDEGYSKQAKDGMTKPTIEHMQEWIRDKSKG